MNVLAQSDRNREDLERYSYAVYQQKNYKLVDPAGDLALIRYHKDNLMKISYRLLDKPESLADVKQKIAEAREMFKDLSEEYFEYDPINNDPLEDKTWTKERISDLKELSPSAQEALTTYALETKFSFESESQPFDIQSMLNMLQQVMLEEKRDRAISPSFSPHHDWSAEVKAKSFHSLVFSKLVVALASGLNSKFTITGKEHQLASWILAQSDKSITLEQMFRNSYRIHQGDVYLTLLGVTNILSRHWNAPARDTRSLVRKLKPYTHTLNEEDTYGHWYHLFGIMTYGFARGGIRASFIANTESLGSHILSRSAEPQEDFVNSLGARLGSKLKNAVENPNLLNTLKSHPNYLNEAYYLSDANISNEIAKRSILLTSLDKIDAYHDRTQAAVDEYFRALSLGMETTEPEVLKNNAYEMLLNARGENVYLISPARSVVGKFIEALEAHKGQFEGTYSQIRLINTLNKLYKQTQGEFAVFSTRRAWYQYRLSQAYESLQPSVSESNEAEDNSISKGQEDPKREALRSRRSLIHGNRKFQR